MSVSMDVDRNRGNGVVNIREHTMVWHRTNDLTHYEKHYLCKKFLGNKRHENSQFLLYSLL